VIQIRVCARFLAAFLTLCAPSTAQEPKPRAEPQRHASSVPVESKTDKEHYEAGRSLEEQGRYEDAVREFQKAILINSKNSRYYDNLAICLKGLRRYDEAIDVINQAISVDPEDSYAFRELGICYCVKQQLEKALKALEQAVSLDPSDAVSYRWLGYVLYRSQKYDMATGALEQALKLRPSDFDAHFWRGMSLLRLRKFLEAIPSFEKARERKPQDKASRVELFTCYLATQQFQKAAQIFPIFVAALGSALAMVYVAGFALLLAFSLPIRSATFPGLLFSVAWLALFFVGQIAFLLLFTLFPPLGLNESVFSGLMLAGLPIILVAATGFARQPWGAPFQWPLRFGPWKVAAISFLLLLLLFLMSAAFSWVYVEAMHKPLPLQHSIPLIRKALRTNPLIAWLAVPVVVPVIEEILFRGLFYGAFEKQWGIRGAILGSAFVFACVHLQFVGFVYVFCIGVILAWARWRSGSLGLPIAIHGLNNATALLALTFLPVT
jgi:membrane protease YdiL (CAAX protease family)/Flp pilus assembly protein TadD